VPERVCWFKSSPQQFQLLILKRIAASMFSRAIRCDSDCDSSNQPPNRRFIASYSEYLQVPAIPSIMSSSVRNFVEAIPSS